MNFSNELNDEKNKLKELLRTGKISIDEYSNRLLALSVSKNYDHMKNSF